MPLRTRTRWSLPRIKALAQKKGGAFLSPAFTDVKQQYEWKCSNPAHPSWTTTANNVIYANVWCPECRLERRMAQLHKNLLRYVKKRGGNIVSDLGTLVNNRGRVRLKCSKGHEWEAVCAQLTCLKTWCPRCAGKAGRPGRKVAHSIETLQALAQQRGGDCLSTAYLGARVHHEWQCANPKHPPWKAVAGSVLSGSWCPVCARSIVRATNVQQWAADNGLRLLSVDNGCKTVNKWECLAEGHKFSAKRVNLQRLVAPEISLCPICRAKKGKRRHGSLSQQRRVY
jgi:hypothetical protein